MLSRMIQLFAALLLVLAIAAGQGNESPEVQLRAAIHMELVEGDLSGAIELYQKVISNSNAPRATVANALLHIGLCHEKLGDVQARPVYRKLIDTYPEQRREVEVAKQRLAEMTKTSAAAAGLPAFQQIEMTARLFFSAPSLSPQGDRMAFTDGQCLWIVPVHGKVNPEIAGVPQRLTEPMNASNQPVWSWDGNWIAFNANGTDVYVISSAGGEPARVVANRLPGGIYTGVYYAISLSPDGTKLAYVAGPFGHEKMYVIPVAGGEAVPLSVDQLCQPAFSPDGKWIACVTESRALEIDDGEPNRTLRAALWVASSNGKDAMMLTEVPGRIASPIWSSDGRMIAYLQDDGTTGGIRELRIMPIREDGRSATSPAKLELPFLTPAVLAGWTKQNEIGILKSVPGASGIYKIAATGGMAALIKAGKSDHPRWSPDGSRIYFRLRGGIAWITSEGGESGEVPFRTAELVEGAYGGSNEPSPDGSRLVFAGYLNKPDRGPVNIWTVSSNEGVSRQITDFLFPAAARFPCWSPDGKVIAFVKVDRGQGPTMYFVPAEGGESRAVTGIGWARIAWSPDGKNIAYFTNSTLNLFNLPTGNHRILAKLQKLPYRGIPLNIIVNEMAWSPDGKQLAYTYNRAIWLVPLDNPQPVRLETGRAELRARHIDWSPDGKWLVFIGETGSDLQLQLMTDFMSLILK